MKRRDGIQLLVLGAIWGASFALMRIGAPEFGPAALAFGRVAGAAAFLLPAMALRGEAPAFARHWRAIALVGVTNTALPFLCFGVAVLTLSSGLTAIFNATTPLFGALIAAAWLKDRLDATRVIGLAIGFAGVAGLAWDTADLHAGPAGVSPAIAIAASLAATLGYGFSASFTKRFLAGVPPLALAGGSQFFAALLLAVPTLLQPPARLPGAAAWTAVALLAILCTGVAYVLYFRILASAGPANAMAVTYLVPAFALGWGATLFGEPVTARQLLGCALILAGTALTTGAAGGWRPRRRAAG